MIPPSFVPSTKLSREKTFETIDEFMSKNIVYPVKSSTCRIQGTELVKFTVNPSGELTNFAVINSVCKKMDKEVIKVLELTNGMWQPGFVNGRPVAMENEVSVAFFLHSEEELVKMAKQYQQQGNNWMFVKNNPQKAL